MDRGAWQATVHRVWRDSTSTHWVLQVTLFCCFTCFYKFLTFFNQHSSVLWSAPSPYGSGFELTNVKLCAFWKVEAKWPLHLVVIASQRQWEADPEVHVRSGFPPLPSLCLAVLADCRIHWPPAPQAHHHMLFCELTETIVMRSQ